MRFTHNPEDGNVVVTLSQRNVRELYHMTQLSQAQGASDMPYLIKRQHGAAFIVQVERDDLHYNQDYDGPPDKVPVPPEEVFDAVARGGDRPPWDDDTTPES